MRKPIVRAAVLASLLMAVPVAAHAQESEPGEPGQGVGIEVEITPIPTPIDPTEPPTDPTDPPTEPTDSPTDDPTAGPTDPTDEPTTAPPGGDLGQTGFTGLPVLIGAGVLVLAGGGALLYRRRTAQ